MKAQKSIIEGNTVSLQGGKDISLTGSAAASTKETALSAGRNISIHAAEETDKEIHKKQVKKRGLIGSGLGFTIGSEKKKDSYDTEETMQAGSTVGSVKGNVTITAGNNVTVRASDIIAGKDTLITGRNVDIESKDNTYRGKEEHEYKKSGLTASLGGTVMNAARSMTAPMKRAGEVKDSRLKALYALQAGMNARDIQKNQKTDKAINKNNAVGINISLGSTGWKDHAETVTEETKGSTVTAGKTAAIIAKEDMTVKGSTVNAKDIHLKAGNNIHILSSENKSTTIEDYKAKSGSIGASLSKGGYGIGASYGKGKGQIEETTLTHTPSDITAKDTVSLSSGNDTLIRGGTIKGDKVTANAGRNLTIESEQDKKNYKETGKTTGLSISYTPGSAVSVSGGKGQTNTDSAYESVTKQTGIYAGQEGYDIQVKNNTRLKGAVIDSQAPAEKNKLTTGTLTWENIDNKAEYKTKASGITVSTNAVSKLNPLGLGYVPTVPVKGKAGSTTYAAIADSIITTTKEKTDKEIRHDTENALNKLSEIFDKKKIEEKQEYVNILSQVGYHLIGDIAGHKENELYKKAEKARKENNSILAEKYEKEAKKWSESGTNRIAMHGIMGALVSKEAGAGMTKGLTGAGLNAMLQKELGKIKDPEVHKMASAAIGYLAGGKTGAAIAWQATTYNYLSPKQNEQYQKELEEAKTEKEKTEITNKWLQIDETQKEKWLKKQEAGTYTDLSTIKDGYLPGVVILGNSNYSDFNWIQSATLNGLGAVTNIPWSGIDDKLLVTLPVRYRNAFGILGKTGILGAGAASFISIYNDYRIYSGGDLRKALAYDVGGTAANIFLSTGTAGMLTAAGIATVPGIFIGAGIAVGGGILIDRGIDTLKQDLILDKDKQLDNKGRGENN